MDEIDAMRRVMSDYMEGLLTQAEYEVAMAYWRGLLLGRLAFERQVLDRAGAAS